MVKTIAIIGKKKSGKTTLVTKLIGIFRERGYRVGAVKRSSRCPGGAVSRASSPMKGSTAAPDTVPAGRKRNPGTPGSGRVSSARGRFRSSRDTPDEAAMPPTKRIRKLRRLCDIGHGIPSFCAWPRMRYP